MRNSYDESKNDKDDVLLYGSIFTDRNTMLVSEITFLDLQNTSILCSILLLMAFFKNYICSYFALESENEKLMKMALSYFEN